MKPLEGATTPELHTKQETTSHRFLTVVHSHVALKGLITLRSF